MTTRAKRRSSLTMTLMEAGVITREEAQAAKAQKRPKEQLGEALVRLGTITEKQLMQGLSKNMGLPYISLYEQSVQPAAMKHVAQTYAQTNTVIPVKVDEEHLYLAMHDPLNYHVIEHLELSSGLTVKPLLATRSDILYAINEHYLKKNRPATASVGSRTRNASTNGKMDQSAVDLLSQILTTGVQLRASDIHIQPGREGTTVRYRIDGDMQSDQQLPKELHETLIARVKILSSLDITQTRLPQDGRFRENVNGSEVDLRVSTIPTATGEKVVIRVLDAKDALRTISELNMSRDNQKNYLELLRRPSGLVLITGPTGSGKSSTLYASINQMNDDSVNVMSIEDPIEIELAGISQVPVNEDAGLTFAAGLRSILRQDPDIIMLGEIRDGDTAEIAIRSAMTGHLVLSTLHTNSAIEAVPRLVDMGVEPYLVSSAVKGVVAQRLVQRICKDCAIKRPATPAEKQLFHDHGMSVDTVPEPVGCDSCQGKGFRGRMLVHEVIVMDEAMRHILLREGSGTALKEYAAKQGVPFLIDDGLRKVKAGHTTIEKVMRIALDES